MKRLDRSSAGGGKGFYEIWLLEDHGELSTELKARMQKEESEEVLKKWLKLAARSRSLEEFVENIDLK